MSSSTRSLAQTADIVCTSQLCLYRVFHGDPGRAGHLRGPSVQAGADLQGQLGLPHARLYPLEEGQQGRILQAKAQRFTICR
jgi:hypothetical protein